MNKIIDWISAIVGGVLWRLGGSDIAPKAVRRIGVSTLLGYLSFSKTRNIVVAVITAILAFAGYILGYGLPDGSDAGGSIAQLVLKHWTITNMTLLMVVVRTICGLVYSLAYLPTIIYLKRFKQLYLVPALGIAVPLICLLRLDAKIEEFAIGFTVVVLYTLIKGKNE